MRILIDECMDERFRNSLPGQDCQTALRRTRPALGRSAREHFFADFKVGGDFQKDAAERPDFQWTMRGDCNLVF